MLYSIANLVLTRPNRAGYRMSITRLGIKAGEKIAITGQSGCGKSTALDLLGMVLEPDGADAFLFAPEGKALDLAEAWKKTRIDYMAELRRLHLGYILQTGGLLPFLTVEENMGLTALLRGMDAPAIKETVRSLAATLGIEALLGSLPGFLSVGERQRVAIGRALASKPSVVLADEPTAALDPPNAHNVMRLLMDAVDRQGTTLVLVTHDPRFVLDFSLREIPIAIHRDSDGVVNAVLDDRGQS